VRIASNSRKHSEKSNTSNSEFVGNVPN